MFLVGIDIGKLSHMFCILDTSNNEVIVNPVSFKNNKLGFVCLMDQLKPTLRIICSSGWKIPVITISIF